MEKNYFRSPLVHSFLTACNIQFTRFENQSMGSYFYSSTPHGKKIDESPVKNSESLENNLFNFLYMFWPYQVATILEVWVVNIFNK